MIEISTIFTQSLCNKSFKRAEADGIWQLYIPGLTNDEIANLFLRPINKSKYASNEIPQGDSLFLKRIEKYYHKLSKS
jgi:hypothetical protein